MKRLLPLLLLLAGCTSYEYSAPTTEPGKVSKLIFMPSGHGSDVAVGFTSNLDTTVTPVSINIPARYGIVFECTHGSFAIEGDKWVPLWKSLHEGQNVTIEYRKVFEVDSKTKAQTFTKFDFLGAYPQTPEKPE